MDIITGEITEMDTLPGTTKERPWLKTSAQIDGVWYSTFSKVLDGFSEGNIVRAEYTVDGKGRHNLGKVALADGSQAAEATEKLNNDFPAPPTEKPRFQAAKPAAVPESLRELRIARQCAIKAAVELATIEEQKSMELDNILIMAQRMVDFIMSPVPGLADWKEERTTRGDTYYPPTEEAAAEPTPNKAFVPKEGWPRPEGELLSDQIKHDIINAFRNVGLSADDLQTISGIPLAAWTENIRQRALVDWGAIDQSLTTPEALLAHSKQDDEKMPF